MPLTTDGVPLGALVVGADKPIDEQVLDTLATLGRDLAVALQSAAMAEEMYRQLVAIERATLGPDDATAGIRVVGDHMLHTQDRDDGALAEGDARRHLLQVFQDPAAVALGEGDGLVDRRAPREDELHAVAGGIEAQGNTPGARVAIRPCRTCRGRRRRRDDY